MGCGPSSVAGNASAQRDVRRTYESLWLDEETDEFDECSCLDVKSVALRMNSALAPYSFSRPTLAEGSPPSIPCLDEEQLSALPFSNYWEQRGRRRQLFHGVQKRGASSRTYSFFNDSRDLITTVKMIFQSDAKLSTAVEVLDVVHVRQVEDKDGFITFLVSVGPLETVTALDIRKEIKDDDFMITYEAEDCPAVVEKDVQLANTLYELDLAALEDARAAAHSRKETVHDKDVLQFCVRTHTMFTSDRLVGVPIQRPSHLLTPDEQDQVRLFRPGCSGVLCGSVASPNLAVALTILFLGSTPRRARLKELFRQQKEVLAGERNVGGMRVKICRSGWWTEVVLDNFFASSGGKYLGVCSNDPCELWPQALEKAAALTLCGGRIHNLVHYTRETLLSLFSGSPCRIISTSDLLSTAEQNGMPFLQYQFKQWVDEDCTVAFVTQSQDAVRVVHDIESGSQLRFQSASIVKDTTTTDQRSSTAGDEKTMSMDAALKSHEWVVFVFNPFQWMDHRFKGTFDGIVPSLCLRVKTLRKTRLAVSLVLDNDDDPVGPESVVAGHRVLVSVFKRVDHDTAVPGVSSSMAPKDKFELVYNSTIDPMQPSATRFSFQLTHCGVFVNLTANGTYLIVPRVLRDTSAASVRPTLRPSIRNSISSPINALEDDAPLSFVLCLRSSVPIERQFGVHVSCERIDGACKIFQNVLSTSVGSGVVRSAKTKLQKYTAGIVDETVADVSEL